MIYITKDSAFAALNLSVRQLLTYRDYNTGYFSTTEHIAAPRASVASRLTSLSVPSARAAVRERAARDARWNVNQTNTESAGVTSRSRRSHDMVTGRAGGLLPGGAVLARAEAPAAAAGSGEPPCRWLLAGLLPTAGARRSCQKICE